MFAMHLYFWQGRDNKSLRRNISTERVFDKERKNWTLCFIDDVI